MSSSNESSASILARGSMWVTAGEVLSSIGATVGTIVAARVLSPSNFGVVGVATLALATLEAFTNTGFQQALIQRREHDVEDYLNTAWTWQLLRGLCLSLLMAAAAPALARWYDLPQLTPIMWACALVPTLNGLGNIGLLVWTRTLDFKRLFAIQALRAGSQLLVSVPAVLLLRNEWALVATQLSGAAVGLLISYLAHPFRPRLDFDRARAKTLLGFGRWVSGGALIAFLITQGDDLFVSRALGTTALGYYQFAYSNANLPATKITHVIAQVSFPTYSRLQGDPSELRRAFRGVARFTILLASLLTVLIWFLIPHIVQHVVGIKWQPTVPLARILAVAGLLRAIAALAGALFLALGKPELDFRMNLPRFVIIACSIYPLTMWKGLEGACLAVLLGILGCAPAWVSGVRKFAGVNMRTLLADNALALIASGILACSFLLLRPHFDMSLLGSGLLIGLALGSSALALKLLGLFVPSLDIFTQARALRATLAKR